MTPSAISHFLSIPWCAQLLSDPNFIATSTFSRNPKASTEDSFIAETLNTDKTIRALLTLYRKPDPDSPPSHSIREVRVILDVGDGLNGYPNVSHGGFVATLLDETMGILLTIGVEEERRRKNDGSERGLGAMTAYLNVKYKRACPTPGVLLVTAKIAKIEGRKLFLTAAVEDGKGTVYAEGDGMFLEIKEKL